MNAHADLRGFLLDRLVRLAGSEAVGGIVDGDADKPARPADVDAFREIMLAVYSSLRAEIVARISAQDVMVNLHLTRIRE